MTQLPGYRAETRTYLLIPPPFLFAWLYPCGNAQWGGRKEGGNPGERFLRKSTFAVHKPSFIDKRRGRLTLKLLAPRLCWLSDSHPPTEDRWYVASSALVFLLWSKDCTTENECEWNWKCQLTAQITRWYNHHDKWYGLGLASWIIGYVVTKGDYASYFHVMSFLLASLKSSFRSH